MRRVTASALAALCASGCLFVVTKDRTRNVKTTERWNAPTPITAAVPEIVVRPRDGGLDIQVTWRRTCSFTGDRIIDQRISKGATVEMYDWCTGKDCGYVYIFAIVAAPFTLAVSGIATAIRVATADDRKATKVEVMDVRRGPCDAAGANMDLRVSPVGLEPQLVRTDPAGRARVEGVVDATVTFAH